MTGMWPPPAGTAVFCGAPKGDCGKLVKLADKWSAKGVLGITDTDGTFFGVMEAHELVMLAAMIITGKDADGEPIDPQIMAIIREDCARYPDEVEAALALLPIPALA